MSDISVFSKEPMLEIYIFETNQLLERLEEILIDSEKHDNISEEDINEVFRIMHTIKGSSAMMMYSGIASLAHALEDMYQFIRESKPVTDNSKVCDLTLKTSDFIKSEIIKIDTGEEPDGDSKSLLDSIKSFLDDIKNRKWSVPQGK